MLSQIAANDCWKNKTTKIYSKQTLCKSYLILNQNMPQIAKLPELWSETPTDHEEMWEVDRSQNTLPK